MISLASFLILITIGAISLIANCQDSPLKTLRNDLFKNYYRYNRPVKQASTAVNVSFSFYLHQITDIDISTQLCHVNGLIILNWRDEFLTWDPAKYSGIRNIQLDPSQVWTPGINLMNPMTVDNSINTLAIGTSSGGRVIQIVDVDVAVSTSLDLTDYPFDKQLCTLEFNSFSLSSQALNLTQGRKLVSGPSFQSAEWIVEKLKGEIFMEALDIANFSSAEIRIYVARRVDIHLYYILLPYLTASLMGLVVFLLPIGSNYRLLFGCLAIFILIYLLIFMADNLGFYSLGVPYSVRCISILLVLTGLALIVTTLTHQLIISTMITCPPLPSLVAHHLASPMLGRLLCLSGDIEPTKDFDEESDPSEFNNQQPFRSTSHAAIREWIRLLRLIDRLLFLIYIIALIFYHS